LADEDAGWRPDRYGFEVLGCRHTLEFPVVKLIDYADHAELLETSPDPFALVTVAHLRTRQTKSDPRACYQAKEAYSKVGWKEDWKENWKARPKKP